jgi:glycosyltransferase 2 family protein
MTTLPAGATVAADAPGRRGRAVVAFAVAALLLLLAFRDVDLPRVWAIVASVDSGYLALALLLDAGIFFVKSQKWRYLAAPIKRLGVAPFIGAIAVGTLASTFLPFRLDELARAAYFGARTGVANATVLGTIVIERMVDVTMLLIAVGALLVFLPPGLALPPMGLAVLAFAGVGLAAFAVPRARAALLSRIGRRGGRAGQLVAGLDVFPGPARTAGALAIACAEWLLTVAYMKTVLLAFALDLPPIGYLALVTAGYLSFALPLAPGALGVFELLMKGSLVLGFAVDPSTAMSCALVLHFMLVAPISIAGAAVLIRHGRA